MRSSFVLSALLAALVALASGSPEAHEEPPDSWFIHIKGIPGDAPDGSFAISGLAWDTMADVGRFAEYTPTAETDAIAISPREAASGLPTGKRQHKPFTITKEIDKATPKLMEACVNGTHVGDVEIWSREGGQAQLRYTLKDAIITSYSVSRDPADTSARPIESITFSYERMEVRGSSMRTNLNSSRSN